MAEKKWLTNTRLGGMAGKSEPFEVAGCWLWAVVEVLRHDGVREQQGRIDLGPGETFLGCCVMKVCNSKTDALDGKPRGTKERTCVAWECIHHGSLVVSDGWSATQAINWPVLDCRHEHCIHSRQKKGKLVHAPATLKKKRPQLLWKNERGFHSNHVESFFSKLKCWARKKNGGRLPTQSQHWYLYLADFCMRHNAGLEGPGKYVEHVLRALCHVPSGDLKDGIGSIPVA